MNIETLGQEVAEDGSRVLSVLQRWVAVVRNQVECLLWVLVSVWWYSFDHFDSKDTHTPDIHLRAARPSEYDFGGRLDDRYEQIYHRHRLIH